MNIIFSAIIRIIVGCGIFTYGAEYENYKLFIPNIYLRFITSCLIWMMFFILINISEVDK